MLQLYYETLRDNIRPNMMFLHLKLKEMFYVFNFDYIITTYR